MTTSKTPVPLNRTARAWRAEPLANSPVDFHRSLPGYAPTPLISLPEEAARLGVKSVLVKDESQRLGLPAFKILGASYAIACALSERFGAGEVLRLEALAKRLDAEAGLSLVAATDGNHGRAVAHVANLLGLTSTIYVPPGVSEAAKDAIVAEGAELVELNLTYDQVVAEAAKQSGPGRLLIQDTSWKGYEDIPQWIVDGYTTLVEEVDEQLADIGVDRLDAVFVPAGVGSLAQAVVHHYRSSKHTPALFAVEPDTAMSVTAALCAGRVVPVDTGDTIMTGLNCGTVSEIAWPTLRDGIDAPITVTDSQALAAVADLTDLGVDSGPCGAANLAALRVLIADDELFTFSGLGPGSVVVLLSTEGKAANPQGNGNTEGTANREGIQR
ncbi:diaminopropionate ammonia-lyase [Brevibacterium zhoupengii]|uniref:diaminopropionate ammonia-lyase n=1 Tax=Brevibacterium zhoupengii TaxID=2898795 RepID=UPI001E6443E5|nr:diaminopropionate ammonia-lyase [Brevibacterium zhoupengii]